MLTIKILGSGDFFTSYKFNYHSMFLFNINDENLLIDAGPSISDALHDANMTPDDISAIYITHLHGDHVSGLEYIGYYRYFSTLNMKPTLFINSTLVDKLWHNVLSGSMEYLNGKTMKLKDYFDLMILGDDGKFWFEDVEINTIKTPHVLMNNMIYLPSYGLEMFYNDKIIYITGDTIFDFNFHEEYYDSSDVIFHDCSFYDNNEQHATYKQLKTLPKRYKEKIYLYHYNLGEYSFDELNDIVKSDGFAGLLYRGQEIFI